MARLREVTSTLRAKRVQRDQLDREIAELTAEMRRATTGSGATPFGQVPRESSVNSATSTASSPPRLTQLPEVRDSEFRIREISGRTSSPRSTSREMSTLSLRNTLIWVGSVLLALSVIAFVSLEWRHFGASAREAILVILMLAAGSGAVRLVSKLPVTSTALGGLCTVLVGSDWVLVQRSTSALKLSSVAVITVAIALVGVTGFVLGRLRVRFADAMGIIAAAVALPMSVACVTPFTHPYRGNPIWFSLIWTAIGTIYLGLMVAIAKRNSVVPANSFLALSVTSAFAFAEVSAAQALVGNHSARQSLLVGTSVLVAGVVPALARALLSRLDPRGWTTKVDNEPLNLLDDALIALALSSVGAGVIIGVSGSVANVWLYPCAMAISAAFIVAARSGPRWVRPSAAVLGAFGGVIGLLSLVYPLSTSLSVQSNLGSSIWSGSLRKVAIEHLSVTAPKWPSAVTLVMWLAVVVLASRLIPWTHAETNRRVLRPLPSSLASGLLIVSVAPATTMLLLLLRASVLALVTVELSVATLLIGWLTFRALQEREWSEGLDLAAAVAALVLFSSGFSWALISQGATLAVVAVIAVSCGVFAWSARTRPVGAAAGVVAAMALLSTVAIVTSMFQAGRNPACLVTVGVSGLLLVLLSPRLSRQLRPSIESVALIGLFVPDAFLSFHNRSLWFGVSLTVATTSLLLTSLRASRLWFRVAATAVVVPALWSWSSASHSQLWVLEVGVAAAVLLSGWLIERQIHHRPATDWIDAVVIAEVVALLSSAVAWALPSRGATFAVVATAALCFGSLAWVSRNRNYGFASAAVAAAMVLVSVTVFAWMIELGRDAMAVTATAGAGALLALGTARSWNRSRTAIEFVAILGLLIPSTLLTRHDPRLWIAVDLTIVTISLAAAALRADRYWYQIAAALSAVPTLWAWIYFQHVHLVEAFTWPAGCILLAIGALLQRNGRLGDAFRNSWWTYGPGLAVTLLPSLVLVVHHSNGARAASVGVVAFLTVLAGTATRLRAPVAFGVTTLGALALRLLVPVAIELPRWVTLAVIGVLLLWLGATAERRMAGMRNWADRFRSLG